MFLTVGSFTVFFLLCPSPCYNLWGKCEYGDNKERLLTEERMWRPSQSLGWALGPSSQPLLFGPHPELQLPQNHGHARAQPCASWVWTLTPTRWLVDVPACPHHQGGAQGWACPVCAPACPAPAWGGQGMADGSSMATPGSPWHPQTRELPALPAPCQIHWKSWLCLWSIECCDLNTQMEKKSALFWFKKVRESSLKNTNVHFLITLLLWIWQK